MWKKDNSWQSDRNKFTFSAVFKESNYWRIIITAAILYFQQILCHFAAPDTGWRCESKTGVTLWPILFAENHLIYRGSNQLTAYVGGVGQPSTGRWRYLRSYIAENYVPWTLYRCKGSGIGMKYKRKNVHGAIGLERYYSIPAFARVRTQFQSGWTVGVDYLYRLRRSYGISKITICRFYASSASKRNATVIHTDEYDRRVSVCWSSHNYRSLGKGFGQTEGI